MSDSKYVSNIWYGAFFGARMLPRAHNRFMSAVSCGVKLYAASRGGKAIVTSEGACRPIGLITVGALLFISRRRSLVVLEFLPGKKNGLTGRLVTRAYRFILDRVCLGIQVMTDWEVAEYSVEYQIASSRIRHIPYFHFDDTTSDEPVYNGRRSGVMASGRGSCDWGLLLDAAQGQGWQLTIVCSQSEMEVFSARDSATDVSFLADLPRSEHDDLLSSAVLYVLPLSNSRVSSGHIRLMSAVTVGTPVIATKVDGLSGYEHLAVATVMPGDVDSLRHEINQALVHEGALRDSAASALREAKLYTKSVYVERIGLWVDGMVVDG